MLWDSWQDAVYDTDNDENVSRLAASVADSNFRVWLSRQHSDAVYITFARLCSYKKQNTSVRYPPDVSTHSFAVPRIFPLVLGPNDSSINRGDREDTGDNEARPDEMGSGPAHPTGDPTTFGGTTSIRHPASDSYDIEQEVLDTDGFEVVDASDGRLGLTNIGDNPAEDWAADTGGTASPENEA